MTADASASTNLNADFARRVAAHAAALAWKASPMPGVERRMLDRVGGEEFLVLEGVFEDEEGDYPAGFYVRNPPHSRHTPGSRPGCTLFVKLWQFDPSDRKQVRIDTSKAAPRGANGRAGVQVASLFKDTHEDVRLEAWAPNAAIELDPEGGLELLVLAGGFREGGETFAPQSCLRLPIGAPLRARAGEDGCRVWMKEGHLRHVRAPQAR